MIQTPEKIRSYLLNTKSQTKTSFMLHLARNVLYHKLREASQSWVPLNIWRGCCETLSDEQLSSYFDHFLFLLLLVTTSGKHERLHPRVNIRKESLQSLQLNHGLIARLNTFIDKHPDYSQALSARKCDAGLFGSRCFGYRKKPDRVLRPINN